LIILSWLIRSKPFRPNLFDSVPSHYILAAGLIPCGGKAKDGNAGVKKPGSLSAWLRLDIGEI